MSDSNPESPFVDLDYVKREWEGRGTDWALQWLVKFVNDTNLAIGVTLTVGGSLISGELISHKAYFDQLAVDFSEPFRRIPGVDPEQVKLLIENFGLPSAPEGQEEPACQYIHLRNARIFSPSGDVPSSGMQWRGKIAAVDGFSAGSLSRS